MIVRAIKNRRDGDRGGTVTRMNVVRTRLIERRSDRSNVRRHGGATVEERSESSGNGSESE
jgi:hypothetical protein